jgi:hypothetical protein
MVSESGIGYICNMECYKEEGKKREGTIISALGCSLGLWHHIYKGNYYNHVPNAQTSLKHRTRVYGTNRTNRGLHNSLKAKEKNLKKGDTSSRTEEMFLSSFGMTREVRMISTNQRSQQALKTKHEKDFQTYVFPAIESTHEMC